MISRGSARRHPARARRLTGTRAHPVSRFFALGLIVLILLPFTAPFPTCELGPQKGSPCDVVTKDKGFEDDLVPVSPWSFDPPLLIAAAAVSFHPHPVDVERLQRTNLRL
jgi:hypothetical protein